MLAVAVAIRLSPPRSGSPGRAAGLAGRRARCRARRACPCRASVGCECVVDSPPSPPLCRRHLSHKNSCPVGKHQTREGSQRERGAHPQPHRKDQADLASCCSSEASMEGQGFCTWEGERREGKDCGRASRQTPKPNARSHPGREAGRCCPPAYCTSPAGSGLPANKPGRRCPPGHSRPPHPEEWLEPTRNRVEERRRAPSSKCVEFLPARVSWIPNPLLQTSLPDPYRWPSCGSHTLRRRRRCKVRERIGPR